jgi:hypothetical protein
MPKTIPPVSFSATGALQLYLVPESGRYVIEAAGAQGGGNPAARGGKGARLRGVFQLRAGDLLNLVVGQQGLPGLNLAPVDDDDSALIPSARADSVPALSRGGGGGGGTFVWKNTLTGGRPGWPLLAAGGGGGGGLEPGGEAVVTPDAARGHGPGSRNGHGGSSDLGVFYYSGGGGTGWLTPGVHGAGPTYCQGGTQWDGGAGASFGGYMGGHGGYGGGGGGCFFRAGAGGGGGYSGGSGGGGRLSRSGGGGSSYNAGAEPFNVPGVQGGDGWVRISCLSPGVTIAVPEIPRRRPEAVSLQPEPRLSGSVQATRLPQGDCAKWLER